MVEVSPWIIAVGAGLVLLAVLVCVASAGFAARGWPIGLRRLVRDLADRVDAAESDWHSTKGKLAADVEALVTLEESIERKRAKAAAAESNLRRAAGAGGPPQPADEREATRQRARARGFMV